MAGQLTKWLNDNGLENIEPKVKNLGFKSIDDIKLLTEDELREIINASDINVLLKKKFINAGIALIKSSSSQSQPSSSISISKEPNNNDNNNQKQEETKIVHKASSSSSLDKQEEEEEEEEVKTENNNNNKNDSVKEKTIALYVPNNLDAHSSLHVMNIRCDGDKQLNKDKYSAEIEASVQLAKRVAIELNLIQKTEYNDKDTRAFALGIQTNAIKLLQSRCQINSAVKLVNLLLQFMPPNIEEKNATLWKNVKNGCNLIMKSAISLLKSTYQYMKYLILFAQDFSHFNQLMKKNATPKFAIKNLVKTFEDFHTEVGLVQQNLVVLDTDMSKSLENAIFEHIGISNNNIFIERDAALKEWQTEQAKATNDIKQIFETLIAHENEIAKIEGEIARCEFEISFVNKQQKNYEDERKRWEENYNQQKVRTAAAEDYKEVTKAHQTTTNATNESGWWAWKKTTYTTTYNTEYKTTKEYTGEQTKLRQQEEQYRQIWEQAKCNEETKQKHISQQKALEKQKQIALEQLKLKTPEIKEKCNDQVKVIDKHVATSKEKVELINKTIKAIYETIQIHNKEHLGNFLEIIQFFPNAIAQTQTCVNQLDTVLSTFEKLIAKQCDDLDTTKLYLRYSKERHTDADSNDDKNGKIDYTLSIEEGFKKYKLENYTKSVKAMAFDTLNDLKFDKDTYEEFYNNILQETPDKKIPFGHKICFQKICLGIENIENKKKNEEIEKEIQKKIDEATKDIQKEAEVLQTSFEQLGPFFINIFNATDHCDQELTYGQIKSN